MCRVTLLPVLAMFKGYFDESTDEKSQEFFIIGGWINSLEKWNDFTAQWNLILAQYGITEFKASDCNARRGEFRNWPNEKIERLRSELHSVLNATEPVAIGVALNLSDYHAFEQSRSLESYHFCFHYCLIEAARKVPERETISLILDYRQKTSGTANEILHSVKNWKDFAERNRLGGVTSQSSKDFAPLQAADWLSNEIFKDVNNKSKNLTQRTRPNFQLLEGFLVTYQDLHEDSIGALFYELRSLGFPLILTPS